MKATEIHSYWLFGLVWNKLTIDYLYRLAFYFRIKPKLVVVISCLN
jgi:hypothetical protein